MFEAWQQFRNNMCYRIRHGNRNGFGRLQHSARAWVVRKSSTFEITFALPKSANTAGAYIPKREVKNPSRKAFPPSKMRDHLRHHTQQRLVPPTGPN